MDKINPFEFWENQQILKTTLVNYVQRCVGQQAERRGEPAPTDGDGKARLDPNALTICFARRFASYKRGDLLLRDLDRLDRLVNNPGRPVQIICAGKAHPKDEPGKRLIQRVFQATRDPRFAGKIVFLEDHDMSVGRHLVQGADVWLNTPRRPLEAAAPAGRRSSSTAGSTSRCWTAGGPKPTTGTTASPSAAPPSTPTRSGRTRSTPTPCSTC